MVSSSSSSSSSKQQREHPQDQQEPFALDIHLSERRIMLNNHHQPERQSSCNFRKRKIFNTRKILKLMFYKLCSTKHTHKARKCDLVSKTVKKLRQIGERKRYSHGESSKCAIKESAQFENQSSVLARTSQSHKNSSFIEQEVLPDSNLQWKCKEENKQFCPGSSLNEASPSNKEEDASTSSTILTKNAEEDSIFSAFLWELLLKPLTEKQNQARFMELQGIFGPNLSELLKNKRVLRNTKQLLFHCINEAIERYGWKFNQEIMGS